MKQLISIILSIVMMLSLLSGCGKDTNETTVKNDTIIYADDKNVSSVNESNVCAVNIDENTEKNDSSFEYDWTEKLKFTGMSDEMLLSYIEDTVYTQLISNLDSTEYFVEDVAAVYISQEYLMELAYNSQFNVFFGYTLSELDEYFEGGRYVFTLGDDGQTTVEILSAIEDTTYEQILKNVAIGTGVILVCVTVSAVTAGAAAPAVNMIFAVAAKTAATCALSGAAISGVSSAVVKGYQTGDFSEALKAGALGASEGYKWGAISGALTGGVSEALGLYSATGNGLTMNQVAQIQKESSYPLSIIKQFHTFDEYTTFKAADLNAEMLCGKLTLVRSDIDLYNIVDEYGRNNFTRMSKGLNPIDSAGNTFEWHHIGQNDNATLALLTTTEHDAGCLHQFKVASEIDRNAFETYKKKLNMDLLNWLMTKT